MIMNINEMNLEILKADKKKPRLCFCRKKVRGKVHARQCLEKQLVFREIKMQEAKSRYRKDESKENAKRFHSSYVSWLNCQRLLKEPDYLKKIYQKNKVKRVKKDEFSEISRQLQVFDNCFCVNRRHSKIPHEGQCLERRKAILWEKVKQAKEKGDMKDYNNAYQIYYVNEKKLRQYESNR
jgi:hypothetical protein